MENAATVEIQERDFHCCLEKPQRRRLFHISHRPNGEPHQQKMCYLCLGTRVTHLLSPCNGGGVAAPVRKCREATEAVQTGWSTTTHVFGMHSRNVVCERPPRPLHQRSLRDIFLMSRPPLLTEEGNTAYPNQFVHT